MQKLCSCGNRIPNRVKVEGKWRNLQSRRRCLSCVPFGTPAPAVKSQVPQRYPDELLIGTARESRSMADFVRRLGTNVSGNMYRHIRSRVQRLGIDTSHWTVGNSGLHHIGGSKRKSSAEILRVYSAEETLPNTGTARRALVETGVPFICAECGSPPVWKGKPLVLQIDHVDGNRRDWRRRNLRFMCPNCHSQTPTHGSRKGARDSSGRRAGCRNGKRFIQMVPGQGIEPC